jgi:hypothetical protein
VSGPWQGPKLVIRPLPVMACAAAVAVGYVASHALELPMVWLDSALGTWSLGARPSSAAMDFFGRALWGFSLGATVAVASLRAKLSPQGARAVALLTAGVIAGALALEVSRLWSRTPTAEEFPAGYDPITGRIAVPPPTRLAGP